MQNLGREAETRQISNACSKTSKRNSAWTLSWLNYRRPSRNTENTWKNSTETLLGWFDVKSCDVCAMRKSPPRKKGAPMQLAGAGFPMERIATDILGPLPQTDKGKRYILVISDYFRKWVEAFPIQDQKAETVAKCLVNEVVSRYGVPSYIHSDQDRQFESDLYQEVCFLLGIKKTTTTPCHPQSDGMVERFNKKR